MGSGADYRNIQRIGPQDLHLFVLNGSAHSGKNSFSDFVCKNLQDKHRWATADVSSVDKVKEAAILLGWDEVKDETGRKFLSDLKDLSTKSFNGPMKYMRNRIKDFQVLHGGGCIFLHIRESSEIYAFLQEFPKAKTIIMKREGLHIPNNHADQNVENYTYDITVYNNEGLPELRDKARLFSEQLAKGELLQREY